MRLLLVAAVLTIAGAVWGVSQTQRETADRAFGKSRAGQQMLTAMLDQESGVRAFSLKPRKRLLSPYVRGKRDFEAALASARNSAEGEAEQTHLAEQATAARVWQRLAREEIALVKANPNVSLDNDFVAVRERAFERYRSANAKFQTELARERSADLKMAAVVSVGVILLVGGLFGGVGYLAIERQAAAEARRRERERLYRETQAEFTETMQIMRDEREAHCLVKEHLERNIPGSEVVVLNRNHSDNRLTATTPVHESSPLAETLVDAAPDTCLAVRLGQEYRQGAEDRPLLTCDLCGMSEGEISCVPSLVSGEVIGSVLVQHPAELSPADRGRIGDSVIQAAPVLANLRNLAIAEARAATDALTGLPNNRSCQENLKRMVAHAGRSVSPLSAILLDLDRFKQINDRFGHGAGDDVLAAVGGALLGTLRASDFAGRYGGEEFLILLPDTDEMGATSAAEKVRAAIERIEVPQVEREITASLGLATYPVHALEGDTLLRMADRALYAAKHSGRNRVEIARVTSDSLEVEA